MKVGQERRQWQDFKAKHGLYIIEILPFDFSKAFLAAI